MEWAGAFGDLGTLDSIRRRLHRRPEDGPFGILFAFGAALVVCGFYYKTPFPVQPMKALGAAAVTQAAQTAVITPATVYSAGLVTGAIWLILGLSGAATRIGKLVPRFVVIGIVLGLGISFMIEGIKLMSTEWLIAALGLLGNTVAPDQSSDPSHVSAAAIRRGVRRDSRPRGGASAVSVRVQFRLPSFALAAINWHDLWVGTLFLALPQLPLTLGNAVIAVREENNRLFPDRPVTDGRSPVRRDSMNLAGAASAACRCAMAREAWPDTLPSARAPAAPRSFSAPFVDAGVLLQRLDRVHLECVSEGRAGRDFVFDGRAARPRRRRSQQNKG